MNMEFYLGWSPPSLQILIQNPNEVLEFLDHFEEKLIAREPGQKLAQYDKKRNK